MIKPMLQERNVDDVITTTFEMLVRPIVENFGDSALVRYHRNSFGLRAA